MYETEVGHLVQVENPVGKPRYENVGLLVERRGGNGDVAAVVL